MKTILLLAAASFTLATANAQYAENFEGTEAGLTGNCWTLTNVHVTNVAARVITGTGSMYTDPPTSAVTKDIITPALNITSNSIDVSFNYKLSNTLSGSASRFIQIGLFDPAGNFTLLHTINLPNSTPTSVFNFSQTLSVASPGWRKLAIRTGGNGSGSSRLIFDDLSTNVNALYGSNTCNSAPVAVNDIFNGVIGSPFTGDVALNDTEPNSETISATIAVNSPDGTVTMNQNGGFTFNPNPGFAGSSTTFTYQLTDNGFSPLTSNIATATINFTAAAPLPVKLVSFSAVLNEGVADLKWTTASEKDVSHFSVEKSLDGRNFTEVGIVMAIGNSSAILNYAFTDININTANSGIIYYRLRSIDVDGKYELSAIRMITIGTQNREAATISTYPNPASHEIRVTIPSSWQGKKVTYEVIGSTGQVSKKIIAASASQTESINIATLSPGFYVARVICNGEIAQQKIIKR